MKYYWLLFSAGAQGVILVEARDEIHAISLSHLLGINPGGDIKVVPIDMSTIPADILAKDANKLLTVTEAEELEAILKKLD